MALSPLNLGLGPDDGNGDDLRTGGQKINDNFSYLENIVDDKADATDVAALESEMETLFDGVYDALAGKQDTVTAADPSDVVPHFDLPQDITNSERAQLVANTGGYVTLQYPLVLPSTTIVTDTFYMPMLPDTFYVVDAFLMLSLRTVGTGGALQVTFSYTNNASVVFGATTQTVTGAGKVTGTVFLGTKLITKELANTVSLTVANSETGSPVAKGLTLFIRGFWAKP